MQNQFMYFERENLKEKEMINALNWS